MRKKVLHLEVMSDICARNHFSFKFNNFRINDIYCLLSTVDLQLSILLPFCRPNAIQQIGHDQQMTPIDFGVRGEGHYDLSYNVKIFSAEYLENYFIFHNLVGHDQQMAPIYFGVTRLKVKATKILNVKMISADYLENHLLQSLHISHVDWS